MPELKYKDIVGDGGSHVLDQVEAQQDRLSQRLSRVGCILGIMSGKGGVGKSTVTANLARILAIRGKSVGVLDADLNGPSMAKLLGVRGHKPDVSEKGVVPALSKDGIRIMSMDFFLDADEDPLQWQGPTSDQHVWRGLLEANTLRELAADTDWGELDVLLIDLPPGSDRLTMVCDTLKRMDHLIAVGIGSDLSQLIVGKSVTLARRVLEQPLLGIVYNMRHYFDPATKRLMPLFLSEDEAKLHQLTMLADIPFDPRLLSCGDQGRSFPEEYPHSPTSVALNAVADQLLNKLAAKEIS